MTATVWSATHARAVPAPEARTAAAWSAGFKAGDSAALDAATHAAGARGMAGGSFFNRSTWLSACAAHLVTPGQAIWTVRLNAPQDPTPQAVVPFIVQNEHLYRTPVRSVRLLGDPMADRCEPTLPEHGWPRLIAALRAAPFAWDVAILGETTHDSATREAVKRAAAAFGAKVEYRLSGRTPVIPAPPAGAKDAMAPYSKRLRKRVRHAMNRMEREGGVTLETHAVTPHNCADLFARAATIEAIAWKGAKGVGPFCNRVQRAFLEAVALDPTGHTTTVFTFLVGPEGDIAFSHNFHSDERNLDYQGSFDPQFGHWSPGLYLIHALIEALAGHGLSCLDASRSSLKTTPVHASFPHTIREHHRLFIYRPTVRGRLAGLISLRVRPLARDLRQRVHALRAPHAE